MPDDRCSVLDLFWDWRFSLILESYSYPFKVQLATPLDFIYTTVLSSELCWPPPGCWIQLSHTAVRPQLLQASFSTTSTGDRERQTLGTYRTVVRHASLIICSALLALTHRLKEDKGKWLISDVKALPAEISQQLVAFGRYTHKPVSDVAHLKTRNRNM